MQPPSGAEEQLGLGRLVCAVRIGPPHPHTPFPSLPFQVLDKTYILSPVDERVLEKAEGTKIDWKAGAEKGGAEVGLHEGARSVSCRSHSLSLSCGPSPRTTAPLEKNET